MTSAATWEALTKKMQDCSRCGTMVSVGFEVFRVALDNPENNLLSTLIQILATQLEIKIIQLLLADSLTVASTTINSGHLTPAFLFFSCSNNIVRNLLGFPVSTNT